MHLTPDEFIDVAEGTRRDRSLPHLSVCETCRAELAAIRTALSTAEKADVPEPSPLYWASLSARINETIDRQHASDRRWWSAWRRASVLIPLSAAALLALVVALSPNLRIEQSGLGSRTTSTAPVHAVDVDPASDVGDLEPDPLLTLVSDLSANLDLDGASAAGFAERDSAEHAVTHMNTDELRALKQLLQAELARQGA